MAAYIVSCLVGVLCVGLGISNRRGNISSLHEYHRKRVSEEDRLPFGKMVGTGTIIIGIAVMLFSVLSAAALLTEKQIFTWIGTGIMILGIVLGTGISFYAMKKYNKGIF